MAKFLCGVTSGCLMLWFALYMAYGEAARFGMRPRTVIGNDTKHPIVHLDEHTGEVPTAVNCDVGFVP